jgi:predicted methyltransferase
MKYYSQWWMMFGMWCGLIGLNALYIIVADWFGGGWFNVFLQIFAGLLIPIGVIVLGFVLFMVLSETTFQKRPTADELEVVAQEEELDALERLLERQIKLENRRQAYYDKRDGYVRKLEERNGIAS